MKIGVVGCAGRMGRMVVAEVTATADYELAGGTEQPDSPHLGQDVGAVAGVDAAGLVIGPDTDALFGAADAVIDFTHASAVVALAGLAARLGTVLVTGTTGLSGDEQAALATAAKKATIVQAANMSVGVSVLLGITERLAGILADDYDIEILDMHHRYKVDAPSGTALALGAAAARGRGVELDAVAQRVRDGETGARRAGDIGFATLRGGDVVSEHSVIFAADGERVELTHKVSSRSIYARSAVRAARWAKDKPPGLYTMADVLGLG